MILFRSAASEGKTTGINRHWSVWNAVQEKQGRKNMQ